MEVSLNKSKYSWHKIPKEGPGPGKRYGHIIIYYAPYLFIFGGSLGNSLTNEVHYAFINQNSISQPIKWNILKTIENTPVPPPRIYHACSIYKCDNASNLIVIHGGRNEKGIPLNDCWGLRKHRNGTWDWQLAIYEKGYNPIRRFQHTITIFYNFLIVLGGRDETNNELPIEIYDIKTLKWFQAIFLNKFRHTTWIVDDLIYIHGGFQLNNNFIPTNDIIKINLIKLFYSNDILKKEYNELKKNIDKKKEEMKKITPIINLEGRAGSKIGRNNHKINNISNIYDFSKNNLNWSDCYEMINVIASGAFGKVIKARNKKTNEYRAIKIITKSSNFKIENFENEVNIMKKMNSINSIRIYEQFNTDKEYVIVMELCDSNLRKKLDETLFGFEVNQIKKILVQLNNTFRIMLNNKIIHRDIKLENILVKYTNTDKSNYIIKLTDYGISKQLATLSQENQTFAGTIITMAPEIIKRKPYDNKCDLWSIGVVIYLLCFKKYPYELYEIIGNVNQLNQNNFNKHSNWLLNDLISKLLKTDPKQRISWEEYFNHPFFK